MDATSGIRKHQPTKLKRKQAISNDMFISSCLFEIDTRDEI